MAVKVSACGSAVRLDFGEGFVTMGLCDSVTPFGRSKAVVETPDLDCGTSADVGRVEQSTMAFTQYWDPKDEDHEAVEENFDDSVDDLDKRTISVQLVSPLYTGDAVAATATRVTWEAECQIQAVTPEELTPEGHYKRTVTLLRKGDITKTAA
jgi:hypothetical protein